METKFIRNDYRQAQENYKNLKYKFLQELSKSTEKLPDQELQKLSKNYIDGLKKEKNDTQFQQELEKEFYQKVENLIEEVAKVVQGVEDFSKAKEAVDAAKNSVNSESEGNIRNKEEQATQQLKKIKKSIRNQYYKTLTNKLTENTLMDLLENQLLIKGYGGKVEGADYGLLLNVIKSQGFKKALGFSTAFERNNLGEFINPAAAGGLTSAILGTLAEAEAFRLLINYNKNKGATVKATGSVKRKVQNSNKLVQTKSDILLAPSENIMKEIEEEYKKVFKEGTTELVFGEEFDKVMSKNIDDKESSLSKLYGASVKKWSMSKAKQRKKMWLGLSMGSESSISFPEYTGGNPYEYYYENLKTCSQNITTIIGIRNILMFTGDGPEWTDDFIASAIAGVKTQQYYLQLKTGLGLSSKAESPWYKVKDFNAFEWNVNKAIWAKNYNKKS